MPTPNSNPQTGSASLVAVRPQYRRGFTMVEMMVVVLLIGLLAGVVGISISGGGQGVSLANAQRNLMVMVQAAQSYAQRNHTRARLIIFADKNWVPSSSPIAATVDPKILRFYGVVYAVSDDPTVKTQAGIQGPPYNTWVAATDGTMLPEGIYFVPSQDSQFALDLPGFASDSKSNAITDSYTYPTLSTYNDHPGTTTGMMQIRFPLSQTLEGDGDWYYFIEFAPDGFYYNINGNNNIYLGAAVSPTDVTIDFVGGGANPSRMFTGVQLRMLGGAALFRSSDDFIKSAPGS